MHVAQVRDGGLERRKREEDGTEIYLGARTAGLGNRLGVWQDMDKRREIVLKMMHNFQAFAAW